MQNDLLRLGHDFKLTSTFRNNLFKSNYSSFDAYQPKTHVAGKINVVFY